MKRLFMLLPILLFILSIRTNAAVIRADASPLLLPGLIEVGQPFTVDIYMNNNDGVDIVGYSMSLVFYSPDASISSVTHRDVGGVGPFNSVLVDPDFNSIWTVWNQWTAFNFDGNLGDTINYTVATTSGWVHGLGEQLYIQFAMQINEEGTFCIDSTNVPNTTPPGLYDWLFDYPTPFNGPYCWEVGTMPEDPEIGVNPGSFLFEGTAGEEAPSAQLLTISNTGVGTLNWTGTWKSSWLGMSPAFGTAPSNVQVFVNTADLTAGSYHDTITVSDPAATNNPVLIPVQLNLAEPPPTIDLSQSYFSFNAIVDSTNPADQYLTIDNSGGGTLEWTVSNSESWLTLTPVSGTDYGNVTLSIDITGLPYGLYYDTIVVSDPDATNNPQIAEVRLQVASSLPILALNPVNMFVAVDCESPVPEDRVFEIYNDGAGDMNFYLEENSDRIVSLTPDSGAVPQSVTIVFDSVSGNPGAVFVDTIWVYSLEADNSPLMFKINYECFADPAKIIVSKDSVNAVLYECGQGTNPPQLPNFTVYNGGGAAFSYDLTWTSDWLIPSHPSADAPQIITLDFDYEDLSPGLYYDTVVVSADNAVNTPESLTVTLTILETDTAPEIYTRLMGNDFYAQESKPGSGKFMGLNNVNPGCMEWELSEDIPWMSFAVYDKDSDEIERYPWNIGMYSNGYGMSFGYYEDTAYIISNPAVNSPYPLPLNLSIWRFYGDCDWNGAINILDVAYLINYLYKGGAAPLPLKIVGDCNCDGQLNVVDITVIVNYLYMGGSPICGNPY